MLPALLIVLTVLCGSWPMLGGGGGGLPDFEAFAGGQQRYTLEMAIMCPTMSSGLC